MSIKPFAAVVLCIAAIGSTASSSDSRAVRYRWEAEKKLYEANKLLTSYQTGLAQGTPAQQNKLLRGNFSLAFDYAVAALDSMDREADSATHAEVCDIAHRAAVRLAQLYFTDRAYDSSISVLSKMIDRVRLPNDELAPAHVLRAQSRQGRGQLDSAMSDYDKAIAILDPPVDRDGQIVDGVFNVPHLVYRIYSTSGKPQKSRESLELAKSYYQALIMRYPKTQLRPRSEAVLARIYADEKDWPAAIASLTNLRDSTGRTNHTALMQIADIRAQHLDQYDSALAIYDTISARLTGRDTLSRSMLLQKKGMVYMNMKRYGDGREALEDLKKRFPLYFKTTAAPQLAIAKSFELEGNWDRAETEYRFLLANYPSSEESFATYFYLSDRLAKIGRQAEADKLLETAKETFDKAAADGAGTPREARALSFKFELFSRKAKWKEAAAILATIYEKFPSTESGRHALYTASTIYRNQLGDTAKADSLFRAFARTTIKVDLGE